MAGKMALHVVLTLFIGLISSVCKVVVVSSLIQAMCVEKESFLEFSSNPLFTPVPVMDGRFPLKDCVLSVSQFTGAERESLVELAKHLGAK